MNQAMQKFDQDLEPDFCSTSQTENLSLYANARSQFIKKVYALLSLMLLLTTGFCSLSVLNQDFFKFQEDNISLLITSFVIVIITSCLIMLNKSLSRQAPMNYIILLIFNIAESYSVSYICTLYEPMSVLEAVIATFAATVGLTMYAITSNTDFTHCGQYIAGFFWSLLWITICITIINIFFIQSSIWSMLTSIGIACMYSIYLIFDTQLIVGGSSKQLTLDNYVLGAMLLYIDIIQIFVQILKVIGKHKK